MCTQRLALHGGRLRQQSYSEKSYVDALGWVNSLGLLLLCRLSWSLR